MKLSRMKIACSAALLWAVSGALPAWGAKAGYLEDSSVCLSCHNVGVDSPAQIMLDSPHGDVHNPDSPLAKAAGCESCHGPSAAHSRAPTKTAPGVSFGPRWNASVAEQNGVCLTCHRDNVAAHWDGNVHAEENLTCVTCHDLHVREDAVRANAIDQAQVCSTCHKPQKDGIHALASQLENNPPCTQCHNPHANPMPDIALLDNRSLGCRHCHDLVAMNSSTQVSDKAKNYHRAMLQQDRTCIDCHVSIAHAPADSVAPMVAQALKQRRVQLFYPGQSDLDWLLSEHPGAQAFRQGRNCQQCHRGDEAAMGNKLGSDIAQPLLNMDVAFSRVGQEVQLSLSWNGKADDQDVALMWGGRGYDAFQRTGCWAACHSDMRGMSRDRGQGAGKYLAAARAQVQRIGQPPQWKSLADLDALLASGSYVNLWRVQLNAGKPLLQTAQLLDQLQWQEDGGAVSATFNKGRWQVLIRRPLAEVQGDSLTFGIAVHPAGREGGAHWVSLPFTFGVDDAESDFSLR